MGIKEYLDKEKIKSAILKFAEYNARYFDAPIPISRIIKKYLFPSEYEQLIRKK